MTRDERQEIAKVKWVKNKCRGTFEFATGFGKTHTAIMCLKAVLNKYPDLKTIVVVPTENLQAQWYDRLSKEGIYFNVEVVIINTLIKNNWTCDILVCDEAHRFSADHFKKIFDCVKYRMILGLTATFDRLDGKHKIMEQYCPVIDKVSIIEALAQGWVSNFKEYEVIIHVDNINDYLDLNKEFTKHFEFLHFDWNLASSLIGKYGLRNRLKLRDMICRDGDESKRKLVLRDITHHAVSFMRVVQKRKTFINNHPKKIEIARKIIESRPNAKIITFSNNVKMAESIGIGQVYTGKSGSRKKNRTTIDEFNECEKGVINSCAKLNEGADLRGLSVAIILGIDSSEIKAVQRRGRVCRKEGGKIAEIFNLVIADTVETKWFENSHKNSPYTVIGEDGLDDILSGNDPKPYLRKVKDYTYRF